MARNSSTAVTTKTLRKLIPSVMQKIGARYQDRPDLMLAAWPSIIGERMAPLTQAVSFVDGVLTIKVKSSTLLSLLSQHEKPKIMNQLRKKFPSATIRNIRFCIG